MTQRTVMRMNLQQMMAMDDKEGQSPETQAPPIADPPNTIHYITKQVNKAQNGAVEDYAYFFGPSRSRAATMQALIRIYPRTRAFLRAANATEWHENNHFSWTETNGDKVLLTIETAECDCLRERTKPSALPCCSRCARI